LGIIALLIVVASGGAFFLSQKKSTNTITSSDNSAQQIKTISPEELGLVATLRDDKKAIKFEITKPQGIKNVEYQITYTKELNGEQVPEGLFGEIKEGQKLSIEYREFGTCSSGRCRYDKVISDVKIILKVTKNDGSILSSEKTVSLK